MSDSDQLTCRSPVVSYLTIHRRGKEQRLSLLVQVSIFGNGDAEACNRTSMVGNHLKQKCCVVRALPRLSVRFKVRESLMF